MGRPEASRRRLIVNADDFGRSASINAAVIRAHREGVLTSASLMMNEPATTEAVAWAKANPQLGVGLHLTLACGHAALPLEKIPSLVNTRGEFSEDPLGTGLKYYFNRALREQLRAEIHAQFGRFRATGLLLDHVNGHLHVHLHPVVFDLLMADAAALGIRHLRLMRDDFELNRQLVRGRLLFRAAHAAVFTWLADRATGSLCRRGIKHTGAVFGLLQDSRVDEEFLLKLLPALPTGDSEVYSHPSLDHFRHELDALVSPRVKALAGELGIQLIRYQDL